jgi:hypothetical protein
MNLIGRQKGVGVLEADGKKFTGVDYDIEVWSADGGLKSARGTLSAFLLQ